MIYSFYFSEKNITFIYPDLKTVIVGKFSDGVLVEGRPSKIVAERCKNGMKQIKVANPDQKLSLFTFKRNNKLRVHQPKIMDPLETNSVYVGHTEERGEGLFARRNIEPNEIMSYYSGIIWSANEFQEISLLPNQTGYDRYCIIRRSKEFLTCIYVYNFLFFL